MVIKIFKVGNLWIKEVGTSMTPWSRSIVIFFGSRKKNLKKSRFNDLTIKEMHAISAISMYNHKTASEVAKELQAEFQVKKNYRRR